MRSSEVMVGYDKGKHCDNGGEVLDRAKNGDGIIRALGYVGWLRMTHLFIVLWVMYEVLYIHIYIYSLKMRQFFHNGGMTRCVILFYFLSRGIDYKSLP